MQRQKNILHHLILVLSIYGFWIVMFAIQKPIFMLFNYQDGLSIADFFDVILHGLKLDFCFAAYIVAIPLLLIIIHGIVAFNLRKILFIYHIIFSILISVIFAIDCILFSYWGFRMDATLIFYLKDFKDATTSITLKDCLNFLLILLPYSLLLIFSFKVLIFSSAVLFEQSKRKILHTITFVLLLPLCFICTRGGVSTATANIGMVYYSTNQFLNLSAINPAFSLFSSMLKKEDFSKEYQYMKQEKAESLFKQMYSQSPSTTSILNTNTPDVLIILLESFSANVKETPTLNALAEEGVAFENCYANAMRTDRGIVSTLTGFLAQPTMSIIKYPQKTRSLPSLAKVFYGKGYKTSMLYGGDINFANMRSFFVSSLYQDIVSIDAFPLKHRLSKWGVNDETTFEYLYNDIKNQDLNQRYFKTFLTLSSHEPFDVNMHRYTSPYVNSVAYTDSCLGSFIKKVKTLPQWNNLLIVLVADHGFAYPKGTKDFERNKYRIPMIWLGGAVEETMKVKRFVNQTDIPATLLAQIGEQSKDFVYSRNVLSDETKDFAFYVFNNGFCFMDSTGFVTYDCNANYQIAGQKDEEKIQKGKAILQMLYRDIEKR